MRVPLHAEGHDEPDRPEDHPAGQDDHARGKHRICCHRPSFQDWSLLVSVLGMCHSLGKDYIAMPKIDLDAIPQQNVTGYPAPFHEPIAGRWFRRLAPATGLSEMGASHVVLKPGGWSSQRHWHEGEDEFLVIALGRGRAGRRRRRKTSCAPATWPHGPRACGTGTIIVNRSESRLRLRLLQRGQSRCGRRLSGHRHDLHHRRLPAPRRHALSGETHSLIPRSFAGWHVVDRSP